ncbi:MAG: hypothetical protein J3K34DRAFT_439533 [Monoraphidium minutum]|nr:MAG: hypothetical protein J3K34DRAFT_439533 [Monoraphidium minutum]
MPRISARGVCRGVCRAGCCFGVLHCPCTRRGLHTAEALGFGNCVRMFHFRFGRRGAQPDPLTRPKPVPGPSCGAGPLSGRRPSTLRTLAAGGAAGGHCGGPPRPDACHLRLHDTDDSCTTHCGRAGADPPRAPLVSHCPPPRAPPAPRTPCQRGRQRCRVRAAHRARLACDGQVCCHPCTPGRPSRVGSPGHRRL